MRWTPPPVLGLALAIALLQGVGGALQKRGMTDLQAALGAPLSWGLLATQALDVLSLALRTPTLVAGVVMSMLLGGSLLMVALSRGDGAKTGIFVGALSGVVFVVANVGINAERLAPLHVAGMACAIAGACLLAAAGLGPAARREGPPARWRLAPPGRARALRGP